MADMFSEILRMSVQGSIVILAVLALRLVLKKAPKRAICLLWLLAGLRLLVPWQIESPVSLQPDYDRMTQQESGYAESDRDDQAVRGEILDKHGELLVGKPLASEIQASEPVSEGGQSRGEILDKNGEVLVGKLLSSDTRTQAAGNWKIWCGWLWLAGMAALALSSVVSYLHLKKTVGSSVIHSEGVWVCGNIDTAFVLGFLRPQIYLPVGLTEREQTFILAHERSHIARHDQWWKLLGYTALALHWFNPLAWLGYALLCRDLEMACDESVIKGMDVNDRKAYSAALVSCSSVHRSIAACPVAFGEVSVKERVRFVLKFKKPGFWITVLAVTAAIGVAVFFLTSPGETMEEKAVASLYAELEQLQSAENLHLEISTTIDGEYDYYEGHEQEFLKSGDDWYRVIDMKTKDGTYQEYYLHSNRVQVVRRESDNIPDLESLDWRELPEEYQVQLYPLLTQDWKQCEVLEVREEASEDGGVITVVLQGNMEETSEKTYYAHTHEFHLDENHRLVGVVEYSHADKYINDRGFSGRFDMESWSVVRFLETDTKRSREMIREIIDTKMAEVPERDLDIYLGTVTICEDPNCTDASHNHSAEDCSDSSCTDPAHGHHHGH